MNHISHPSPPDWCPGCWQDHVHFDSIPDWASLSERLFVSDLSWRKSCWGFWNQTSPHHRSPVTSKLLNWGSIYTLLSFRTPSGSHSFLTRPGSPCVCPRRLSPVLTHGQPGTSHPLCAGWSVVPLLLRSVLDPQCVACGLTPDLQHTEADVAIREGGLTMSPFTYTCTTVSKYKQRPSWGEGSRVIKSAVSI